MKTLNRLMFGLCAVTLVGAIGCAKNNNLPVPSVETTVTGGNGSITVSIASKTASKPAGRALLTNVPNDVATAFENNIVGFTAYVFDFETGTLEAVATSSDGTAVSITDLNTAGTKRIAVVANNGGLTGLDDLVKGDNYSDLLAQKAILTEQIFSDSDLSGDTKGFLMTGEHINATTKVPEALQLMEGNNSVAIEVDRVVSKIQLGVISFSPDVSINELAQFQITGASIQRAIDASPINPGAISIPTTYTASAWYGGYDKNADGEPASVTTVSNALLSNSLDLTSTIQSVFTTLGDLRSTFVGLDAALVGLGINDGVINISNINGDVLNAISGTIGEAGITSKVNSNNLGGYWYVLPNNLATTPTLLTLKGRIGNEDYFYPIEINAPTGSTITGPGNKTGQYIQRNTIYTINLTFNNLIGTKDPDTPGKPASITVSIFPSDWEGPIVQDVEW